MSNAAIQEWTQSVIAVVSIVGVFALGFWQLLHGQAIVIPDVYSLLVGAVVGTYFGRTLAINGARQAGTAAGQAAARSAVDAAVTAGTLVGKNP